MSRHARQPASDPPAICRAQGRAGGRRPRATPPKRDRIRLNMDRWRWLPRDLGQKYIIVNVPELPRDAGRERRQPLEAAGDRRQAVDADAAADRPRRSGVILNPWWEVPKSIEKEAAGKKGFVPLKGADGKIQRWRQPPGPTNALGQVKFVMPNSKAIYLHDTNARSRFNDERPRAQPRLHPHAARSSTSRRSCSATTTASGRRTRSRRRSPARRPCRRTS